VTTTKSFLTPRAAILIIVVSCLGLVLGAHVQAQTCNTNYDGRCGTQPVTCMILGECGYTPQGWVKFCVQEFCGLPPNCTLCTCMFNSGIHSVYCIPYHTAFRLTYCPCTGYC
jgi:hypothetical protein